MARRWLFLVVAVVAVLAWVLGRPRISNAVPLASPSTPVASADRVPAVVTAPLPSELTRVNLEPAVRDPFLAVVPPTPVIKAAPPPPVVEAPPPPPAPPP